MMAVPVFIWKNLLLLWLLFNTSDFSVYFCLWQSPQSGWHEGIRRTLCLQKENRNESRNSSGTHDIICCQLARQPDPLYASAVKTISIVGIFLSHTVGEVMSRVQRVKEGGKVHMCTNSLTFSEVNNGTVEFRGANSLIRFTHYMLLFHVLNCKGA